MKRKKKDSGGSLDSLLDTITTVVGILIILLIVVQLGADSAVKRIVEEKKEEDSKELMELAMKQFAEQRKALIKEKEDIQLKQASQNKDQQKLIMEIAQLEKKLAEKKKEMPPAPLKLQNLREQKNKLQKDVQSMEVKFKKVKGLLAKAPTPAAGQTLSKEVSLPDPKPAIAGSTPYRFLCRNGKIFPLDDVGLKESVSNTLKKAGVVPNKDKEYDAKKFLAAINGNKVGNPFFSIVAREDKDKVIRFTMERKDKSGESESQVSKSGSLYTKIITDLNPRKNYLLYEVFPDSFGVYMAARDLANQAKFPAGWKPAHRGNDWWSYDWGYRTLGRKEYLASRPKPPPKPSTGKPAPPRKPANVLD